MLHVSTHFCERHMSTQDCTEPIFKQWLLWYVQMSLNLIPHLFSLVATQKSRLSLFLKMSVDGQELKLKKIRPSSNLQNWKKETEKYTCSFETCCRNSSVKNIKEFHMMMLTRVFHEHTKLAMLSFLPTLYSHIVAKHSFRLYLHKWC